MQEEILSGKIRATDREISSIAKVPKEKRPEVVAELRKPKAKRDSSIDDEHGKSCDKWESFPTKEEATNRKKQIEHELASGTFLIPSSVTVAEFLMDWLPKQCSKHKWAPKTYESNLSTIQNLIIPYIGSMEMQQLQRWIAYRKYTI